MQVRRRSLERPGRLLAYFGTVALVDEFGQAQQIQRYAVPAEDDAAEVVGRMMGDVRELKRQDPTLTVGIVQDGAPEMWNLARTGLDCARNKCSAIGDRGSIVST